MSHEKQKAYYLRGDAAFQAKFERVKKNLQETLGVNLSNAQVLRKLVLDQFRNLKK